ncbi:macro domain-containing protein [Labilithrix luteola]|nr:macro domain-containing protein [Labilithrix luteola]
MPTMFVKGDMFATPEIKAFAHGVNCAGRMEAGIAVAFKKRWPAMFEAYAKKCEEGTLQPGDVFVWKEGDQVVFNLAIAQEETAKPKLNALVTALGKTIELAKADGIEKIAMPRLGAAKAKSGLDWTRVRKVITETAEIAPVTLMVFEQFVRQPAGE